MVDIVDIYETSYMKIFHLIKSAYTAGNTILYGWISKPYWQYIREKLRSCEREKRSDGNQPIALQANTTEARL